MNYERMEEEGDGLSKTSPMSESFPQPIPPMQQPQQQPAPAVGQNVGIQQTYIPQTPGPQVIIIRKETPPISKSSAKPLMILGAMQVALGVLMIIFNIAALCVWAMLSFIGAGFWVGIMVIVTGAFGIVSSKTLKRGYVITFMVLSIITAVFVWNVVGFAAGGLPEDTYGTWEYPYGYNGNSVRVVHSERIAMNCILLILGIVESITAIVASAICCGAICCQAPSNATGGQVQYLNHHPQQQQHVLLVPYQPGQNVQYMVPATAASQPHVGQPIQYAMAAPPPAPNQQPGMMSVTPPPMYQTLPPPMKQEKGEF